MIECQILTTLLAAETETCRPKKQGNTTGAVVGRWAQSGAKREREARIAGWGRQKQNFMKLQQDKEEKHVEIMGSSEAKKED